MNIEKANYENGLLQEGLHIHEMYANDEPVFNNAVRSQAVEDCLKKIFGCSDMYLIQELIIEEAVEMGISPVQRESDILDEVYYCGTATDYLAGF